MDDSNLSEEIQEPLEVDDKPEEVRKYGKKEKKINYKYLLFIVLLLIGFYIYITLDQFIIDKKIKKDLTKKENNNYKPKRGDEYEKIKEGCDMLIDLLEKIIDSIVDSVEKDESLDACLKLLEAIKALLKLVIDVKKNLVFEEYIEFEILLLKEYCDIIKCMLDSWETKFYEKCFPPGSRIKDYIYNFLNSDELEILKPFKSIFEKSEPNYDVTYIYPRADITPIYSNPRSNPSNRLYNPIQRDYICGNINPVIPYDPIPIGLNYY